MQPHLSARFAHVLDADGAGHTVIESGQGSAPALHLHWQPATGWSAAGWLAAFGGDEALLHFLTCQDEAIARTCDQRWASTRIALPVAVDTLQPLRLSGELQCPRLQAMGWRLNRAWPSACRGCRSGSSPSACYEILAPVFQHYRWP